MSTYKDEDEVLTVKISDLGIPKTSKERMVNQYRLACLALFGLMHDNPEMDEFEANIEIAKIMMSAGALEGDIRWPT